MNLFKSSIKLNVMGSNINRFINRIVHSNISILSLKKINDEEIIIVIYKNDLDVFNKLLSIYECEVVEYYGFIKLKKFFFNNSILLFFLVLGIFTLFILSNIIFDVEVIYDKKDVESIVLSELKKYGISKYHFVKKYDDVLNIKNSILNDYKDKLEWLEIERVGVKYIVRLEERKLPLKNEVLSIRNVVAKKDCIIKNVYAYNGVIVKKINDYVKKGDVIITGDIKLNEEIKNQVVASGKVFGEVWYKSNITLLLIYNEVNYGSSVKNSLEFNFLSHNISLFGFDNSNSVVVNSSKLVYNSLLPFNISLVKRREANIYNKIYTIDEALDIAEEKSINSLKNKLDEDSYIISSKRLKFDIENDKVNLEMFFSVYENITDYDIIEVQE